MGTSLTNHSQETKCAANLVGATPPLSLSVFVMRYMCVLAIEDV